MNELTTMPQRLDVERAPASGDPMDIMRFAIEKGSSVETIERLMVVRKELMAEKAKKDFDEAMAAFQSECPIIEKRKSVMNKGGNGVRYKYAPIEDIVSQVKELLSKHGFSFYINSKTTGKVVESTCFVTHRGGYSRSSEFAVETDPEAFMNVQQRFASAMTFSKRYAFCNSFGIMTADEDMDGRINKDRPKGPSSVAPSDLAVKDLVAELWRTLTPIRGPVKNWNSANQWMWDEAIISDTQAAPDMTADELRSAIQKAKSKLA